MLTNQVYYRNNVETLLMILLYKYVKDDEGRDSQLSGIHVSVTDRTGLLCVYYYKNAL